MTISRSVILPTNRSFSPTGSAPASISAMMLAASRMVFSGLNRCTSRVIILLTFMDLPPRLQPAGNVPAAAGSPGISSGVDLADTSPTAPMEGCSGFIALAEQGLCACVDKHYNAVSCRLYPCLDYARPQSFPPGPG